MGANITCPIEGGELKVLWHRYHQPDRACVSRSVNPKQFATGLLFHQSCIIGSIHDNLSESKKSTCSCQLQVILNLALFHGIQWTQKSIRHDFIRSSDILCWIWRFRFLLRQCNSTLPQARLRIFRVTALSPDPPIDAFFLRAAHQRCVATTRLTTLNHNR